MEYQGAITLSKNEQRIHMTIEKYRSGEYSRKDAANKLDLSERQISRIAAKVREFGLAGVKHKNCGKVPVNKISDELVKLYVEKYRDIYSKFNFSHALEMMAMHEEMDKLSYTRFRKACRAEGLGKVKKRRASKARIARERHAEEGYMWQLDGSPEAWFGKEVNCLVALIDDATSIIPNAELHPTETTWACMKVVMKAILKYGRPEFILTDKAGWSEGSGRKRRHFSQFERACRELDITVIATPSAESKGRVERLNRTFQDRLIPELDLVGIKSLIGSNQYIDQVFIPGMNEKFAVKATKSSTRYRLVDKHIDLAEIFCIKHDRAVNRDHTISYSNSRYRIFPSEGKTYKGKSVKIHEYDDKTISIFYGNKKLEHEKIDPVKRIWEKSA